jgi:dTDP-4-dehydrorhamnose reductase
MRKTAVIGASGFIGRHLLAAYRRAFPDCVGTCFSKTQPGLTPFDLRAPDLPSLRLEESGHEAVLIASAKPNIAYCDKEPDAARAVNVTGTLELVRQIARTSLDVVFLSTDYVLPGGIGPHDDDAPADPATEYGRQKAEVEKELPHLHEKALVLRLSKIYGLEKGDGTLLDEQASQLVMGRTVLAAADQFFSPTYVDDLVQAILAVQNRRLTGIVNVASPERTSRYQIAMALAAQMDIDPQLVKKIALYDMPSMAGRPRDTSLKSTRLEREIEMAFLPLNEAISRTSRNWKT